MRFHSSSGVGEDRNRASHLRIQDQLVLPAVRGVSPALADDVRQLAREHAAMRTRLDVMLESLETGRSERFVREIQQLAQTLAELERREEALVEKADRATWEA